MADWLTIRHSQNLLLLNVACPIGKDEKPLASQGVFLRPNPKYYMLTITNQLLPLGVDDLKSFLRIEYDDDDAQLLRCLKAGINYVEHAIERDVVERSYIQTFDCFENKLQLDRSPLISIDGFAYDDEDETEQNFADYEIVNKVFARPVLKIETDDFPDYATNLQVSYTTGFATASPILEQAILYCSAHFYLQRETEVIGTITSPLKLGVQRLINQLKAGGYR